ncbi:MAG: hypothetical protein GXO44_03600 [Deferribacteres bacterium]|nr:hypothetical protein [Deferribacteres bacterium]
MDNDKPKIYIVGAGPGDPELITLKGKKLLEEADVVVYAGSLVNEELLKFCKKDCLKVNSHGKRLEELVEVMSENARKKRLVVRLATGDPGIYSSLQEMKEELAERGVEVEVIPGVSAISAAAAAIKEELTIPHGPQSVVITRLPGKTPVPPTEDLARFLATKSTTALFLSADKLPMLKEKATRAGLSPDTTVKIVYKASWPQEKITTTTIKELDKIGADNPSIVFVLPGHNLKGRRSYLYSGALQPNRKPSEEEFYILPVSETKVADEVKRLFPKASAVKEGKLSERLGSIWNEKKPILIIGSTGIAVRVIAPFLSRKSTDPPVLVMDITGSFVIPLTGGHYGANRLAKTIAEKLGCVPVITTGTEALGVPSLEEIIHERELILLGGSTLSFNRKAIRKEPVYSIGLGFHDHTEQDKIKAVLDKAASMIDGSFSVFATIDRRKEAAERLLLPLIPEDSALILVKEKTLETFPFHTESQARKFLKTPAVAEPAALSVLPEGELVVEKKVLYGITFAIGRWKPE